MAAKEATDKAQVSAEQLRAKALSEFKDDIVYLDTLANKMRQQIVILLGSHLEEGMTADELAEYLSASKTSVIKNLRQLEALGIVTGTKGIQSFYYLTLDDVTARLSDLSKALKASYPDSPVGKLIREDKADKASAD